MCVKLLGGEVLGDLEMLLEMLLLWGGLLDMLLLCDGLIAPLIRSPSNASPSSSSECIGAFRTSLCVCVCVREGAGGY